MLANPILLWTLGGLAIPVAIHLLSRKEGRVLKLGSLRHVQETSTQQFRGIRLNEIALLLLRCALITLFCLIVAGLYFPGARETKWVVVEQGLDQQPRIHAMIDSLVTGGYESHWLARGFPDLGDSVPASQPVNYRELVIKLEALNISSIIVFASNSPGSFNGVSIPIASNIRWISQPGAKADYTLETVRIPTDSVANRIAHSDAIVTTYIWSPGLAIDRPFPPPAVVAGPVISVGLVTDRQYDRDRKIFTAALRALHSMIPFKIVIEEDPAKAMDADWRVWLSDGQPPSEKVIKLSPGNESDLLVKTGPSAWTLTKRLNEHIAIESNLSVALAEIIIHDRHKLEGVASEHDSRLLPDSLAWSFNETNSDRPNQAGIATNSTEPFLLIAFLIILMSERILAYHRKQ
jgi:hypothetical protein